MTSHREAPKISKDPVADNTDLYAFVSPDKPDTATILANYIPLEEPAGGPNFNTFGDDVLYEIVIDNNGDGIEDITYQFRFKTTIGNPDTFLYNTGPIGSLTDSSWNVKQSYSVTKVVGPRRTGVSTILGSNLPTPPVNIGPRSTPNYADLANAAINTLSDGSTVFAGQRDEAFYVDLGSIFDLGTLRPVQNFHLIPTPAAPGVDATKGFSVHSIAIQVTGIPAGIIPGFQNFTGPIQADYLRLNLAIPPNNTNPSRLGLVGGDPAGFPNGRRVLDDVVDIEIKAIAGATLPLVDKNFTTDGAVSLVTQGIPAGNPVQPPNTAPFLSVFPYLPHPVPGYEHSHDP